MNWSRLLLAANIVGALLIWLGRNEWSHRYIRVVTRRISHLNPWFRTNQLLQALLAEVKDSSGRPLREALEHLGQGLDVVQATLAMIHVRQRMYDRLLDNATITTDADGRLTWASEGFLVMTGCTLDEIKGDGWISAIHQADRHMVAEEWRSAVNDGRDFVLTYRYRATAARAEVTVEAHAYAARVLSSQAPVGWVAIVRPAIENAASGPVELIEPRVTAARLRMDQEMRCYHPETGGSTTDGGR